MISKEEITELDEEDIEVEIDTRFNLLWTCPNCHEENVEYDISPEETILCECEKCSKKYEYYYNPY